MKIVIDIPDEDLPNKQDIMEIDLHFIDGKVCECTYPYTVLPSKCMAPNVLNHWIGAEVLDKIQTELYANAELHEDGDYYLREEWIGEIFDKYKPGNAINTHNKWD